MNVAENDLNALTVQCVRGVRFGAIDELRRSVESWSAACNADQKGVYRQFTIEKARIKLKSLYPKIKMS